MFRILVMMIIASILVGTFLSCQNKNELWPSEKVRQEAPDQESWNSTVTFTVKGNKRAIIRAGHMAKYFHTRITLIDQGLEVQFFDEEGRPSSMLTAQRGIVNERTQDLEAIGKVVVISLKGTKLETEKLHWDPKKGKIVSDEFVRLSTGKGIVTGIGFEADQSLEHWSIKKGIRGIFKKSAEGR